MTDFSRGSNGDETAVNFFHDSEISLDRALSDSLFFRYGRFTDRAGSVQIRLNGGRS